MAALSPFLPGDSLLHRRDPRAKVIGTFALVLSVSLLPPGAWGALLSLTVVTWGLTIAGELRLSVLLRRSLVAIPFLLGALVLPVTTPGEVAGNLPLLGWSVTEQGLVLAASLIWRAWLAIQAFILLSATTRVEGILWALQALGVPALFVAVVGFTYRYFHVLAAEAGRMLRSRRSRITGAPATAPGVGQRLRISGGLIGALFLRGLARSERVYAAMIARGYDGTVRRLRRHRLGRGDWWGLAGLVGVLAAVLGWTTLAR